MPLFKVKFSNTSGQIRTQTFTAVTQEALRAELREKSFFPLAITVTDPTPGDRRLRLPTRVLTRLLNQLEIQLRGNVAELEAVRSLKDTHSDRRVRHVLGTVYTTLSTSKTTFTDALSAFPRVIPPHLRAILATGEGKGRKELADRLKRIREWLTFTTRVKSSARRAFIQPAILGVLASGYLIVLVTWFLPQLRKLVLSLNAEMPRYTELVIAGGLFVGTYWPVMLGATVTSVATIALLLRRPAFALLVDRVVLALPIYGLIYRGLAIAQVAKNLAPLIHGGVVPVAAIGTCAGTFRNRALIAELHRIAQRMQSEGASLGVAMQGSRYFPAEAISLIVTAEGSGTLAQALDDIGNDYESVVKESVETALTLLQPAIVIVTGILVAGLIFAMILPLRNIYDHIR